LYKKEDVALTGMLIVFALIIRHSRGSLTVVGKRLVCKKAGMQLLETALQVVDFLFLIHRQTLQIAKQRGIKSYTPLANINLTQLSTR